MPNLTVFKWGDQERGTPGGVVTWSLVGAGVDNVQTFYQTDNNLRYAGDETEPARETLDFDPVAAIREAFAAWEQHADITFVQVRDDGEAIGRSRAADIRVAFGDLDGSFGPLLGVAYFPFGSPIAGDILIDNDEDRFFNVRQNFISVITHEIGHSLGLDHTGAFRSLMNDTYNGVRRPQADDIAGIQAIYGASSGEGGVLQLSIGRPDVDVREAVANLEIRGTGFDNVILGGAGSELISGRAGDDQAEGRGGADTIFGGAGDDDLSGDLGADLIGGGAGRDAVFGGAGDDTLRGARGADDLDGQQGDDLVRGGGGGDRLIGGDGDDDLRGGGGDDVIGAGAGNDTLRGGAGDDTMAGGEGADVFVFDDGDGGNEGGDRIFGFEDGVDLIDVSRLGTVSDFDDLIVVARGDNAVVRDGAGVRITMVDFDAADIDAGDFIF